MAALSCGVGCAAYACGKSTQLTRTIDRQTPLTQPNWPTKVQAPIGTVHGLRMNVQKRPNRPHTSNEFLACPFAAALPLRMHRAPACQADIGVAAMHTQQHRLGRQAVPVKNLGPLPVPADERDAAVALEHVEHAAMVVLQGLQQHLALQQDVHHHGQAAATMSSSDSSCPA